MRCCADHTVQKKPFGSTGQQLTQELLETTQLILNYVPAPHLYMR